MSQIVEAGSVASRRSIPARAQGYRTTDEGHYMADDEEVVGPDEDFEEYFCQDNNRDPNHLVGQ